MEKPGKKSQALLNYLRLSAIVLAAFFITAGIIFAQTSGNWTGPTDNPPKDNKAGYIYNASDPNFTGVQSADININGEVAADSLAVDSLDVGGTGYNLKVNQPDGATFNGSPICVADADGKCGGGGDSYWQLDSSGDYVSFKNTDDYDVISLRYQDASGNSNPRVGIGTNDPNPSSQLHIHGLQNNYNNNSYNGNAEIDLQAANVPPQEWWGIYQVAANKDLRFWNIDDRVTFTQAGKVGIGTKAPSQTLEVAGNLAIGLSGSIGRIGSGLGYGCPTCANSATLLLYNGGTGATELNNQGNYDIKFQQGGVDKMVIKAGNVGIGTVVPSQKLQVRAGNIAIDGGYNLYLNAYDPGASYLTHVDQTVGTKIYGYYGISLVTRGTGLKVDGATGKVGIGTASPSTKLQVGAKVNDDNSYSYDANSLYVIHQTPTAAATLNDPKTVLLLARQGTSAQAYGAAAAFNLSRYENIGVNSRTRLDISLANTTFDVNSNNIMTLLSSGNVGIGATAPAEKFEVRDNSANPARIRITDTDQNPEIQLQYGTNASDHWGLYVNQTGKSLNLWNGSDRVTVASNGQLLLGDTDNLTTYVSRTNIATLNPPSPVGTLPTFSVTNDPRLGKIQLVEDGSVDAEINLQSKSNAPDTANDIWPSGSPLPPWKIIHTGNDWTSVDSVGKKTTTMSGSLDFENNGRVVASLISQNIDEWDPAKADYKLGGLLVHSFISLGGKTAFITTANDLPPDPLYPDGKKYLHIAPWDGQFTKVFVGANSVTQPTDFIVSYGNVGIGTAAPSGKLDVNDSFYAVKGAVVIRPQDASNEGGELVLLPPSASYNKWHLDSVQGRFRIFEENGVGLFVIRPTTGNVGIGTFNPSYKLDVNGSINASGGLCINGDCRTSWPTGGGGTNFWTMSGNDIYNNNGGNIRIGTTAAPPAGTNPRVYVSGGIQATGPIYTYYNGSLRVNLGNDGNFYAAGNATVIGNVGIGTLTPYQKLEVNGGIRLNTTTSKPDCGVTTRGTMWFTQNASDKDTLEVCVLDAPGYFWRSLINSYSLDVRGGTY